MEWPETDNLVLRSGESKPFQVMQIHRQAQTDSSNGEATLTEAKKIECRGLISQIYRG